MAFLVGDDLGATRASIPHRDALSALSALLNGTPGMDSAQWVTGNAFGYLRAGTSERLAEYADALYRGVIFLAESARIVAGQVAYAEQATAALAHLFKTRNVLYLDLTWSPRTAAIEEELLYQVRPHMREASRTLDWQIPQMLAQQLPAITDIALIDQAATSQGFVTGDGRPDARAFFHAVEDRITQKQVAADYMTSVLPHMIGQVGLEEHFNRTIRHAVRNIVPTEISVTANRCSPVPGGLDGLRLYRWSGSALSLVETPPELIELDKQLASMCSRVSVMVTPGHGKEYRHEIQRAVHAELLQLGATLSTRVSPFGSDRSAVRRSRIDPSSTIGL